MDAETLTAIANVTGSVTSLTIALAFCGYLMKQIARRDDLIFEDWKRQRDKEISEKEN